MTRLKNTLALGLLAALAVALSACASGTGIFDGGAGGTGIGSATIQGNIMIDGGSLANVKVIARGTNIQAVTDDNGFFMLIGIDAGGVTVEFVRSGDPQPATVDVLATSGSIVTLTDVRLVGDSAEPQEIDLSNIVGQLVEDALCSDDGTGSFSVYDGAITFTVSITTDTTVERNRHAVACGDLTAGTQVKLRGRQLAEQIIATDVRVLRSGPITP